VEDAELRPPKCDKPQRNNFVMFAMDVGEVYKLRSSLFVIEKNI
jgi:hypothetical protein